MGETWFTHISEELGRFLTDAERCAEVCEAHLESVGGSATVDALAAPAAVSRVIGELLDQPAQLVLSAVRLCRDLTAAAAAETGLPTEVAEALQTTAASADVLLRAAG